MKAAAYIYADNIAAIVITLLSIVYVMGETDNVIDVTTTKLQADEAANTLTTIVGGLCNKTTALKAEICSTLAKTSFTDVAVTDMHGRGNTKFSKEYLASNLITLIELIDCINPIVKADPPVVSIIPCSPAGHGDHVQNINSNIQDRLDSFDNNIKSNQKTITEVCEILKKLVNNQTVCTSASQNYAPSQSTTDSRTPDPPPTPTNPTWHVDSVGPGFVSSQSASALQKFLDSQTFVTVKGRSVLHFGEPYSYTASPSSSGQSSAIPEVIKAVVDTIEAAYPNCDINSCVVNKYVGSKSYLPEHSDNESTLRPGSSIFTLSIGSPRNITFRDRLTGAEKTMTADHRSLYVMSQPSQSLWTHRIDVITGTDGEVAEDVRYSITFRSVGKNYKNSTIILGDSNTKYVKFGDGVGTFGYAMPGYRKETFHIGDIDPTACIGYRNVIVNVGINDLRDYSKGRKSGDPHPEDVQAHHNRFVEKLDTIRTLCPNTKLIVAPALPTKLSKLNGRAMAFNRLLQRYTTCNNVMLLDYESFADGSGCLLPEFGLYQNPSDPLHLGRVGILGLVAIFRDSVLKSFVDARSYSGVLNRVSTGGAPTRYYHD